MYEVKINGAAAVTDSFGSQAFAAIKQGKEYGKYMLLRHDGGVVAVRTHISDMNCDIRSQPFVTYCAGVEEGRFTVRSLALSSNGADADIELGETAAEKTAGAPLEISVTVVLNVSRERAAFTGGDNPLIKWLLVGGTLGQAKMGIGRNRGPLSSSAPASMNFLSVYDAEVEFTDCGVKFTAQPADVPYEACLLLGGKTAMRALPRDSKGTAATASGRTSNYNNRLYVSRDVLRITGVKKGSVPVTDYEVYRGRNAIGGAADIRFKAVGATRLIGDGDCKLAAAVGGGRALVMKVGDGEAICLTVRKTDAPDEKVRLCSDGSLFTLVGNVLTITDADGKVRRMTADECDDFEVCTGGGGYLLALKKGANVEIYELGESPTLKETIDAGECCAIGKADGKRLTVCGKNIGGRIISASETKNSAFIASLFTNYDPTEMKIDGHMLAMRLSDGTVYGVEYMVGDGNIVCGAGEEYGIGGEAVWSGNKLALANISGGVDVLTVDGSGENILAYCRLGDFAVRLLESGKLENMALCGSGLAIASDTFGARETVTYTYLAPASGSGKAVLSVDFSGGEQ